MMTGAQARALWSQVMRFVAAHPPGTRFRYEKRALPRPTEAGAARSFGLPMGQSADFRFAPTTDCRGVHVQEYADAWIVHIDQVHPACDPVDHLRHDAPATFVAASAGLGGAIGAALGGSKGAVVAGIGVGLVFAGLALLAVEAAKKSRYEQAGRAAS